MKRFYTGAIAALICLSPLSAQADASFGIQLQQSHTALMQSGHLNCLWNSNIQLQLKNKSNVNVFEDCKITDSELVAAMVFVSDRGESPWTEKNCRPVTTGINGGYECTYKGTKIKMGR